MTNLLIVGMYLLGVAAARMAAGRFSESESRRNDEHLPWDDTRPEGMWISV
ncbi:MAG TPA: hypothetical protein PL033_14770 [Candidatus Brocadiia bacterium]|nr:hypothetical protein [Candidatus Brocadiia bacterium]